MLGSVGVFIIGGLVLGVFVSVGQQTAAGCLCVNVDTGEQLDKNLCNTFDRKNYVFFTGVLNVYVEESGKVGVYCIGGEEQGTARQVEERSGYKVNSLPPELWDIIEDNIFTPVGGL